MSGFGEVEQGACVEADAAHPQLIVTERGAGYVFNVAVETLY